MFCAPRYRATLALRTERSRNTLLCYHVVIVLRFLGLNVVCWSASEQPTTSTEVGTGVLCVLTWTHPCDDPPKQDGEPSERQLELARLLVRWLLLS